MKEKINKNYDIDYKKEMSISNIKPFLPAIDPKYVYTLVLDLDETLVHYFYVRIKLIVDGNWRYFLNSSWMLGIFEGIV